MQDIVFDCPSFAEHLTTWLYKGITSYARLTATVFPQETPSAFLATIMKVSFDLTWTQAASDF